MDIFKRLLAAGCLFNLLLPVFSSSCLELTSTHRAGRGRRYLVKNLATISARRRPTVAPRGPVQVSGFAWLQALPWAPATQHLCGSPPPLIAPFGESASCNGRTISVRYSTDRARRIERNPLAVSEDTLRVNTCNCAASLCAPKAADSVP